MSTWPKCAEWTGFQLTNQESTFFSKVSDKSLLKPQAKCGGGGQLADILVDSATIAAAAVKEAREKKHYLRTNYQQQQQLEIIKTANNSTDFVFCAHSVFLSLSVWCRELLQWLSQPDTDKKTVCSGCCLSIRMIRQRKRDTHTHTQIVTD